MKKNGNSLFSIILTSDRKLMTNVATFQTLYAWPTTKNNEDCFETSQELRVIKQSIMGINDITYINGK